ncbi:MAG: ATP-binding cassette domain-containing protein, partial [Gemmatimonadota bacterium]
MLVARALHLAYPNGPRALDGVSLDLGAGIYGLLGPNGAGKSTLLRVLATLQRPDTGSVRWQRGNEAFDVLAEPARLRARLGSRPQDVGLYPTLSVGATLEHFCALEGARTRAERRAWCDALLARTNLLDRHRAAWLGLALAVLAWTLRTWRPGAADARAVAGDRLTTSATHDE